MKYLEAYQVGGPLDAPGSLDQNTGLPYGTVNKARCEDNARSLCSRDGKALASLTLSALYNLTLSSCRGFTDGIVEIG